MKQVLDTEYGQVTVKDVMIRLSKKEIEEGVEIKCPSIDFKILISGVEAEDFDETQVEDIIRENS